jgi:hypothetical protein
MRLPLLLIPLLALPCLTVAADVEVKLQQLKDIGMLPEEKLGYRPEEKLDPKRSNPFAERAKAKETKAVETVETEEIKIRRIFDTLKISGLTKYNGKYSALLGDLIIEEGAQLAPVIPNQTQILRVTRVTDKFVEILWVEGAGYETVAPRRIIKRVELNPRIGVLLAAQPVGTSDPNAMTYLDENGKVMWPKKMAPDLEGMIDTLPNTGTAALTPGEEAALLEIPAPPGDAATAPAMAPAPFTPESRFSAEPTPGVNPAAGIEDAVLPAPAEDDTAPAEPEAPPANGS